MWIQHVSTALTSQGLADSMGGKSPEKEGGELFLADGQVLQYTDKESAAFCVAAIKDYEKAALLEKQRVGYLDGSLRDTSGRYGEPKQWQNLSLAFSKEEASVMTPENFQAAREAFKETIEQTAADNGGKATFFIDNWHFDRDHPHIQARVNTFPVDLENKKIGSQFDLVKASTASAFADTFKEKLAEKMGIEKDQLERIEFRSASGAEITVEAVRSGQVTRAQEPAKEPSEGRETTTFLKAPVASFSPDLQRIASVEREASKKLGSIDAQISALLEEKSRAELMLEDTQHAKAALLQRDEALKERDKAEAARAEAEKIALEAEQKAAEAEAAKMAAEAEKAKFEEHAQKLSVELEEKSESLQELTQEYEALGEEKTAIEHEKAVVEKTLTEKIEVLTTEKDGLIAENVELDQQIGTLENALDTVEQQKAAVEAEAKAQAAQAQAALEMAAAEKATVEAQAAAALEKAAAEKATIEALAKEQAAQAQAALEKAATENERIKQIAKEELAKAAQQLSDTQKQLSDTQKQLSDTQKQLMEMQDRFMEQQKEFMSMMQQQREFMQLQAEKANQLTPEEVAQIDKEEAELAEHEEQIFKDASQSAIDAIESGLDGEGLDDGPELTPEEEEKILKAFEDAKNPKKPQNDNDNER